MPPARYRMRALSRSGRGGSPSNRAPSTLSIAEDSICRQEGGSRQGGTGRGKPAVTCELGATAAKAKRGAAGATCVTKLNDCASSC